MQYIVGFVIGFVVEIIFLVFRCRLLDVIKMLPDIKQMKIDIEVNEENCMNTFDQLMDLEKEVEHLKKVMNLRNVEF